MLPIPPRAAQTAMLAEASPTPSVTTSIVSAADGKDGVGGPEESAADVAAKAAAEVDAALEGFTPTDLPIGGNVEDDDDFDTMGWPGEQPTVAVTTAPPPVTVTDDGDDGMTAFDMASLRAEAKALATPLEPPPPAVEQQRQRSRVPSLG